MGRQIEFGGSGMARILALVVSAMFLAGSAAAEPYPAPTGNAVVDIAGVLPPESEVRLATLLATLEEETGVEAAVVTIRSRQDYHPVSGSIEAFATGLFNAWGIGDAGRNDGILLLVVPEDRETRLELGAGYDQGYDVLAQDIVDRWLVPAFRDRDYAGGIELGMQAAADRIARRHAARLAPEPLPDRPAGGLGWLAPWLVGGLFAGIAGFALFGRRIADVAAGLRRCPSCGSRGLRQHRATIVHAGPGTPGIARIITECERCGHRDEREERIGGPRRKSGDGGGFGGGRSSGGGASGRW